MSKKRRRTDGVDEVIRGRMGMEGAGLVAVTNQADAIRMSERVDADAVDESTQRGESAQRRRRRYRQGEGDTYAACGGYRR